MIYRSALWRESRLPAQSSSEDQILADAAPTGKHSNLGGLFFKQKGLGCDRRDCSVDA